MAFLFHIYFCVVVQPCWGNGKKNKNFSKHSLQAWVAVEMLNKDSPFEFFSLSQVEDKDKEC